MAGSLEHSLVLGVEGIDVAGAAKRLGTGCGVGEGADGGCAVGDAHARGASLELVDGDGERGAEHRRVVLYLLGEVELAAAADRHRYAEHAAGVLEHEVDLLGGNHFGGDDEVALVLAVLVIDDNHEFALAEILQCLLYTVKLYFRIHAWF